MAEPVWDFFIREAFGWGPGRAMDARCVIGRKLLRAMMDHGVLGLTPNQLQFTHGAAPAIPLTVRICFHDRLWSLAPTDWTTITAAEVDATHPNSGLPKIPDEIRCVITGETGTAQDPCPTITAWAAAFASSPANATW